MKSFYIDNGQFIPYSLEHLIAILISIVIGIWIIYYSRKQLSRSEQRNVAVCIAILAAVSQLAKVFIKLGIGNFDQTEDIPLHLCNILPFLIAAAFLMRSRTFWAILYFWIMAGTFQSLFTPTLKESFPHYEFLRYWIVHCGLVIVALYPIFVWNYRIRLKDVFYSWIGINIMAFSVVPINMWLGSNYMYMMGKPPGPTMYDLLGPWPWYILVLEFVSLLLFGILYLPFHLTRVKATPAQG